MWDGGTAPRIPNLVTPGKEAYVRTAQVAGSSPEPFWVCNRIEEFPLTAESRILAVWPALSHSTDRDTRGSSKINEDKFQNVLHMYA
jgi:hypothetical protein